MKLLDLNRRHAARSENFDSVAVESLLAARGEGGAHVYSLFFEPGGAIGRHPAGPGQLLVVTSGAGWVAGADGRQVAVSAGQAAFIAPGEPHAKGSETGMTALMIQLGALEALAPEIDSPTES